MKKYGVFLASILFLAALASTSFAAEVKEEVKETFSLVKDGSVSVENVAGEITVHAWNENKVQMIATKCARAFTKDRAEELLEAIEINIIAEADSLDIDTHFPWWEKLNPHSSVEVDYELWVPLSAEVIAESVSGSIEVVERENDIWARTVSGTVEIRGIVGDVEAKTTSGAIEIRAAQGESILADSTSGEVRLEEVVGIVEVRSVSGRVRIADSKGAAKSVRTTSGDIWVELKELDEAVSSMLFTSVSGDVTLLLPQGTSADIEARTTSGQIRSEFAVTVEGEMKTRTLRGTIGEGGVKVTFKTVSGNITLEER